MKTALDYWTFVLGKLRAVLELRHHLQARLYIFFDLTFNEFLVRALKLQS